MGVEHRTIYVCDECGKEKVNQPMAVQNITIITCDRCKIQKKVEQGEQLTEGRTVIIAEDEQYNHRTGEYDYQDEEDFWLCNTCLEFFRKFMSGEPIPAAQTSALVS